MRGVIELARTCGWLVYHTHDSRHSAAGFPDLVMCKPGHPLVFWECKRAGGRVTPDQEAWLAAIRGSLREVVAGVIRPADWPHIEATLCAGASRRVGVADASAEPSEG